MPKRLKSNLPSIPSNIIFLLLGLIILLGAGTYLAIKNYSEPGFKIQNMDIASVPNKSNPNLKNQEYLEKLLAKEWYWIETVVDSSVGIKPYNITAFKIKFNPDLSFGSSSDCNNLGGNFEVFENKIKFKDIVRSEKYCMKSRETEFIEGLSNVSEIMFNEKNELILKYKDSTTMMRFK
jgi:heat shock protein HslJ